MQGKIAVLPPPSQILCWNPKLHGYPCQTIEAFDEDLVQLVTVLKATCYAHNGMGLAAPQIDVFKKVAIVSYPRDVEPIVLVNPTLDLLRSRGTEVGWEGCLSLPGSSSKGTPIKNLARVNRCSEIYYRYHDLDGRVIEAEEKDPWRARVIQHEMDHLDGVFFIDRVAGDISRSMVLRNLDNFKKHKDAIHRNGSMYY
jgi:peptide deformylase